MAIHPPVGVDGKLRPAPSDVPYEKGMKPNPQTQEISQQGRSERTFCTEFVLNSFMVHEAQDENHT